MPIAFGDHLKSKINSISKVKNEFTEFVIDELINEAIDCGAVTALDLKMFISIKYRASDSNYRVSDISGLASQVEVRSPFLDYRVVEFASRLQDKYKVNNIFSPSQNKFLPKSYFLKYVPKNVAFSSKKGMGWNIQFNKEIVSNKRFESKITNALKAINNFNIESTEYENSWSRYKSSLKKGKIESNDALLLINGMMLGIWLQDNNS